MKISDATLQIQIGANLTPENQNLAGMTHVGMVLDRKLTAAASILSARLIFSTAAQTVTFDSGAGTLVASAAGTAQVENLNVTASGVTPGNLALTLTSAKVAGSPLAISVPLTAGMTSSQVAAAILAKLASLPVVTQFFTVSHPSYASYQVLLTSIYAFANDATLNLAINGSLGVTGVTNSTNTTAGVAGVLIERAGGDGKDVYGGPWIESSVYAMTVRGADSGDGYCDTTNLGRINPGNTKGFDVGNASTPAPEVFTAGTGGTCTMDVVAICQY